jgi:hypothetical protein
VKIHIKTRAHLRRELWPDGTLAPKQAKEVKSEIVGDQKTFEYEPNGDGPSAATEGSLFGGL